MDNKKVFEEIVGKCIEDLPVVYTRSVRNSKIISRAKNKHEIIDARSAGYFATGMSADTQKSVVLVCNGNIESRSIASAATEAYYRRLPVIFITVGDVGGVDYKKEIKDTFVKSFYITQNMDKVELVDLFRRAISLCDERIAPIHIVVNMNDFSEAEMNLDNAGVLNVLKSEVNAEDYCFVSKFISVKPDLKCKVYIPSDHNFEDGAIATVLGASLSGNRKRYIGLITENELIHDLNTLGNICMNDRVIIIALCKHHKNFVKDYAINLGFEVLDVLNLQICHKKTMILIER